MARILVVDDTPAALEFLVSALSMAGFEVGQAPTIAAAERMLSEDRWDAVVSDVNLDAGRSGIELLAMRRSLTDPVPFVLVTGGADVQMAVDALRAGAYDFLPKPVAIGRLVETVRKAIAARGCHPPDPSGAPAAPEGLVGHSPPMVEVFRGIARAARVDSPVLIRGEEGVGKELVAREIHRHSARGSGPFVVFAGAPDSEVEKTRLAEAVNAAGGGTLYLDRANGYASATQRRLARLLEKAPPVDGTPASNEAADVRYVSSVLEGSERTRPIEPSLGLLLSVIEVRVPPLRERVEDLELLMGQIVSRVSARVRRGLRFSPDALAALRAYAWPGNVRELAQVIERAALDSHTGEITAAEVSPLLLPIASPQGPTEEMAPPREQFQGGRYVLDRFLVRTQMSEVWEATQPTLGRRVIVKFLMSAGAGRGRFEREARIQATLRHPNIPTVYEAGVEEGGARRPFIVLEHVEGLTLDAHAQALAGKMGAEEWTGRVLRLLAQVASALDYLHGRGIVHRDVKPQNVITTPEEHAFLIDYGLARALDVRTPLTRSGVMVGTPTFMAPEQFAGGLDAVNGRTDVWGLGATAYVLLAGRPPFDSVDYEEFVRKVREEEPVALRLLNPSVTPEAEAAVLRCLRKSPADRFSHAADLAQALLRAAGA